MSRNLQDLIREWRAKEERILSNSYYQWFSGERAAGMAFGKCADELEQWLNNDFQTMVKEWKVEAEKTGSLLSPSLKCPHLNEDGRSCSKCGQLLV